MSALIREKKMSVVCSLSFPVEAFHDETEARKRDEVEEERQPGRRTFDLLERRRDGMGGRKHDREEREEEEEGGRQTSRT